MKKIALVVFAILPILSLAQIEVTLSVNQPPEFGFSLSSHTATIARGSSIILGTDLKVFGGSGDYKYKWTPGSTLSSSTILNPIATPTDTTAYMLNVTDKNGCSFSLFYAVNVRLPYSTNDQLTEKHKYSADLFPNPNDGKFKLHLTGLPANHVNLIVFTDNGEIVARQDFPDFNGDLTETLNLNLVSGTYLLQIEVENERLIRKFIIQ
jgi:hypothetical protein